MIMEAGRVCRKVKGKDAGIYCVVVEKVDKTYVIVDGKGMKRTKVNALHLEPLPNMLDVSKDSTTDEIVKKLEEAKIQ